MLDEKNVENIDDRIFDENLKEINDVSTNLFNDNEEEDKHDNRDDLD